MSEEKVYSANKIKCFSFNQNSRKRDSEFTWYNLTTKDVKHSDILNDLDSVKQNILLAPKTRPRIVEYDDGVVILLKTPSVSKSGYITKSPTIRIYMSKNKIITIQQTPSQVIQEIMHEMESDELSFEQPVSMLSYIIKKVLSKIEASVASLDHVLDMLEENLMRNLNISEKLFQARKQLILVQHYIMPQREVFYTLSKMSKRFSKKQISEFVEAYSRLATYIDDIEHIRQKIVIIKDERAAKEESKISWRIYLLTIISVSFLPLNTIFHATSTIEKTIGLSVAILIVVYIIAAKVLKKPKN